MTPLHTFSTFPKMPRLSRDIIITEKIDGTNAQISITDVFPHWDENITAYAVGPDSKEYAIYAGSRNRWITPANDNFGFASWVRSNAAELVKLGNGRHFGEWWGSGIQRGYGLKKGERFFSLFNALRWADGSLAEKPELLEIPNGDPKAEPKLQQYTPSCVGVVPTIYRGPFNTHAVDNVLNMLKEHGSNAVAGYMNPEGVVVYRIAGNVGFKKTFDDNHKG